MEINEAVLCELCTLAYREPSDLEDTLFGKFESFQGFQFGGAECIIAYDSGVAIVVVRGSQTKWIDWLANLQFLWPNPVHRGFRRYANRLGLAGIWQYLDILNPETIWFAGHSLGGATAAVLAWDSICRGLATKTNLFSVGSPRSGVTDWANQLAATIQSTGGQIERFVDPADLIPHLPPAGFRLLPAYRHVGETRTIIGTAEILPDTTLQEGILAAIWNATSSPYRLWKSHSSLMYMHSLLEWVRFRRRNRLSLFIDLETQSQSTDFVQGEKRA